MYKIQSDILDLWALGLAEIRQLKEDRIILEHRLGLQSRPFELNADPSFLQEFKSALTEFVIPNLEARPEQYPWNTHWWIVDPRIMYAVGGIGMAGPPDEYGQVMIGYFINKHWEGRGYARNAVGLLCDWIRQSPEAKSIIADTPSEHLASQRVLQANGFRLAGTTDKGIRWILKF